MTTFYQYLSQRGLSYMLDSSPEQLSALRKQYQRSKKKEYQKKYIRKRVRRVVIFTNEEYALLKKASKNHKLPFSTFVRQSSLNYLSNCYIVPDKEQTRAVLIALKRYGVNLNQISHQCNAQKFVSGTEIKDIQQNFKHLKENITKIYQQPIQIEDLVREIFNNEPEYLTKIQNVINEFKS